jgi:hypothetical protein
MAIMTWRISDASPNKAKSSRGQTGRREAR